LNSYLNLDTSKYVLRYSDPTLNILKEKEFECVDSLNIFKEKLLTEKPLLDVFLSPETLDNSYELELIQKFKTSLDSGFKYAVMATHPLYSNAKELIEFMYYNYNDDNLEILYNLNLEFPSLVLGYCFTNIYNNPVTTTHELLTLLLTYNQEEEGPHFFKHFLIIYNDPLSIPHSINISALFNDFLGLKHEYESSGEHLPEKLKAICDLI